MVHLQGKTRKLLRAPTATEPGRDWMDAYVDKQHLHPLIMVGLLSDCRPPTRTDDAYLDKLLEQLSPVEVPKPHITWGIYKTAFTKMQRAILNDQATGLAGSGLYGFYDLFCVLEAKSVNDPLEAAENACMRSGCAMVNTRRSLNRAAYPPANQASASSPGLSS